MRHLTILSLELALLLSSRIRYGYGYVVSSQSSGRFFLLAIAMRSQKSKNQSNKSAPLPLFICLSVHRNDRLVCSSHGLLRFRLRLLAIAPIFIFQADEEMAAKKSSSGGGGGIKGFLTRAGSSFYAGGLYAREKGAWLAQKAGRIGFIIATTSIVTLMPLIFEITREGQVCSHAVCLQRLGSVLFPPAIFFN